MPWDRRWPGWPAALYATTLGSTAGPDAFDFNRSIMMLAAIIIGGLGSLRGTLLGVLLLVGFDNVITPLVDGLLQSSNLAAAFPNTKVGLGSAAGN